MSKKILVPPRNRAYLDIERFDVRADRTTNWIVASSGGLELAVGIRERGLVINLTEYSNLSTITIQCRIAGRNTRIGLVSNGSVIHALSVNSTATYQFDLNQYPTADSLYIPDVNATIYEVFERVEITEDIMNWDELNIRQARDGFSGVFISIQQGVQLCRHGMTLIKDMFHRRQLLSKANVHIYRRGAKDFNYVLIHSMALNFGSYEEHPDYIEVEGRPIDFRAMLKSYGKTKYDIPAEEFQNIDGSPGAVDWRYMHNDMIGHASWTLPEDPWAWIDSEGDPQSNNMLNDMPYSMTAVLGKAEMIRGGLQHDIKDSTFAEIEIDQATGRPKYEDAEYLFLADRPGLIHLDIRFDYRMYLDNPNNPDNPNAIGQIWIYKINGYNPSANPTIITNATVRWPNSTTISLGFNGQIAMNENDRLILVVAKHVELKNPPYKFELGIINFQRFEIQYLDRTRRVDNIRAVPQLTFINTLLKKMTESGMPRYIPVIDSGSKEFNYDHFLVAGEAIRGYDNAMFHISLNDFIEYMQFLGYEYVVNEDTKEIRFRQRDIFFRPYIIASDLTEKEVSGLIIKASDEYAYSAVKIGYNRPDIDNTNGRFAIMGAFDYTTDYINNTNTESTLEILCPYKADPVEMEILSWTRDEKTTDKKNDNDVYMLAGRIYNNTLRESRDVEYFALDGAYEIGYYNAPYIPYYILRRNTGRICIIGNRLRFVGTDSYRDAVLRGVLTANVYSDITGFGLFLPAEIEFNAGTWDDLPEAANQNGIVRFTANGRIYEGFIKEIMKNGYSERSVVWTLYARNLGVIE